MTVYELSLNLAEELKSIQVDLGDGKNLNMLADLKATPRTGKSVRIDKFDLNLEKQSIYDHELILAYLCDLFMQTLGLQFDKHFLADLCIFHDLSESIVGDVPQFTSRDLAGDKYREASQKVIYEQNASELILRSLPSKYVERYQRVIDLIFHEESETKLSKFFLMVDKTEPIISIWRYIYFNRELIDIDKFLFAMTDFFTNPKVASYAICNEMSELVRFLQNKEMAKLYFAEGFAKIRNLIPIPFADHLKEMVERKEILYV